MLRAKHRTAMHPGPQRQTQVPLPGHLILSLLLSAGRPILPETPTQLWGMVPMLQGPLQSEWDLPSAETTGL